VLNLVGIDVGGHAHAALVDEADHGVGVSIGSQHDDGVLPGWECEALPVPVDDVDSCEADGDIGAEETVEQAHPASLSAPSDARREICQNWPFG
jgi:hypothetical protein